MYIFIVYLDDMDSMKLYYAQMLKHFIVYIFIISNLNIITIRILKQIFNYYQKEDQG